jgi:hypothetical protein
MQWEGLPSNCTNKLGLGTRWLLSFRQSWILGRAVRVMTLTEEQVSPSLFVKSSGSFFIILTERSKAVCQWYNNTKSILMTLQALAKHTSPNRMRSDSVRSYFSTAQTFYLRAHLASRSLKALLVPNSSIFAESKPQGYAVDRESKCISEVTAKLW